MITSSYGFERRVYITTDISFEISAIGLPDRQTYMHGIAHAASFLGSILRAKLSQLMFQR